MDLERSSRLIFVEFVVFLTMLAKLILSPNQHKIQEGIYNDDFRNVMIDLFSSEKFIHLFMEELP